MSAPIRSTCQGKREMVATRPKCPPFGNDQTMGFNRRRMNSEHAAAAAKERKLGVRSASRFFKMPNG
jgi:hypothetical protein